MCPNGYTGVQCGIKLKKKIKDSAIINLTKKFSEKEVNECASSPCKNNGKCLDLIDSFFCQCPKGFAGITCDNSKKSKININLNL